MTHTRVHTSGPIIAGISLILASGAFIAVFSILAGSFGYPDILDRPAGDVLPRLLALGAGGRAVWAVYACIPLLLIPAAVGAASLHTDAEHQAAVRIAEWCAALAGVSMMLGLVRWPSLQWELARAWGAASADQRVTLSATFDGANTMFGRYIGEFLGELLLNASFVLFSVVAWFDRRLPRWASGFGMLAGSIGLIALWRNVAPSVALIADVNNAVLPLWLIVWGVVLCRSRGA